MDWISALFEPVLAPLLGRLDRLGLFPGLRFAPLSRVAAALTAIVLVAYLSSLLMAGADRRVRTWRGARVVGRLVTLALAWAMVLNVLSNADFVGARLPSASGGAHGMGPVLLIVALMVFLEIRLYRRQS